MFVMLAKFVYLFLLFNNNINLFLIIWSFHNLKEMGVWSMQCFYLDKLIFIESPKCQIVQYSHIYLIIIIISFLDWPWSIKTG